MTDRSGFSTKLLKPDYVKEYKMEGVNTVYLHPHSYKSWIFNYK
jgi:hypothetical protein